MALWRHHDFKPWLSKLPGVRQVSFQILFGDFFCGFANQVTQFKMADAIMWHISAVWEINRFSYDSIEWVIVTDHFARENYHQGLYQYEVWDAGGGPFIVNVKLRWGERISDIWELEEGLRYEILGGNLCGFSNNLCGKDYFGEIKFFPGDIKKSFGVGHL